MFLEYSKGLAARVFTGVLLFASVTSASFAGIFDGKSRVEITDSTGGLSWDNTANALTVSCWFKIVIPSDEPLNEDMVILADRKTGSETDNHAYLIKLNHQTGNLEFSTKGASGSKTQILIERPYLDRWYHIAVVRDGSQLAGFVDGREKFDESVSVGDAKNTDGVSIGGWNGKHFKGEIQEVRVFRSTLTQSQIAVNRFRDLVPDDWPTLFGYFRLAVGSTFINSAKTPPTDSDQGVKAGDGTIEFEETNEEGEQSLFDATKNQGKDAVVPLSGAFTWQHEIFSRPTVGIDFEFLIGYSSANVFNDNDLSGFNPWVEGVAIGDGWRHSFEARAVPSNAFTPINDGSIGILHWDGNLDVWEDDGTGKFVTRHREYRGELELVGNPFSPSGFLDWITPDRIVFRFRSPFAGDPNLQGRLVEIRDYNGNRITIDLLESGANAGKVERITDTGGGVYEFSYNPQGKLTQVKFGDWEANFTYNGDNLLETHAIFGPAEYPSPGATDWEYRYTTKKGQKLLNDVRTPRGPRDVNVTYDDFGRKIRESNGLGHAQHTKYHTPEKRKVQVTDENGNIWTSTFDRQHRLVEAEDPLGNKSRSRYDEFGNVIEEIDARRNATLFTYDDRANVTSATNPEGEKTVTIYHPFFNVPVEETDAEGFKEFFDYDAAGNLKRHSDLIGDRVVYDHFPNGQVSSSTDGNENVTLFTYTAEGFPETRTEPGGFVTQYTHNEWGWTMSETNALNETTTFTRDINGKVLSTTDSLLRVVSSTWDANGNLTSTTDAKGETTTYQYDNEDRRKLMTTRDGKQWRYEYFPTGKLEYTQDPNGKRITNSYDEADRLRTTTDPLGFTETFEYDANGNRIRRTDKEGRQWITDYDSLNRVIANFNPLGNVTRTTYDPVGRVDTVTNPNGSFQRHHYDRRGRLIRWIDGEGSDWYYEYDNKENIRVIKDALQGEYRMDYGPRDERIREINQDDFVWTHTYDPLLRLKTTTDPNNLVKIFDYDAGGRMREVQYSTGRTDLYGYDNNDNVTSLSRVGSGPTTLATLDHDVMDRLKSYTGPFSMTVGYTYDDVGRIASLVYPGGKALTYSYDDAGRLEQLTDWDSRVTTFSYDRAGRLKGRTYPNGVVQAAGYDTAGRQTELSYKKTDETVIAAWEYAYDRNSNLTSAEEEGTLNWPVPSRVDETRDFSKSGRIRSLVDSAQPDGTRDFTYDFDDAGNLVSATGAGQAFGFTYDEDNRTTAISWDAGLTTKTIENRYDVLGRRVSKTEDGIESRFVLDLSGSMERILCDVSGAGVIEAYYVHANDLCYRVDAASGEFTCFHSDTSANIVSLTDSGGEVSESYAYTPYGRNVGDSGGSSNPYRYVGSQGVMEELPGLYFMRARYYSADAMVFLSTDPVKNIGPGWRPERYLYAGVNPIRFTDADGNTASDVKNSRMKRYNLETSMYYQESAIYYGAYVGQIDAVSASLTNSTEFAVKGFVKLGEKTPAGKLVWGALKYSFNEVGEDLRNRDPDLKKQRERERKEKWESFHSEFEEEVEETNSVIKSGIQKLEGWMSFPSAPQGSNASYSGVFHGPFQKQRSLNSSQASQVAPAPPKPTSNSSEFTRSDLDSAVRRGGRVVSRLSGAVNELRRAGVLSRSEARRAQSRLNSIRRRLSSIRRRNSRRR